MESRDAQRVSRARVMTAHVASAGPFGSFPNNDARAEEPDCTGPRIDIVRHGDGAVAACLYCYSTGGRWEVQRFLLPARVAEDVKSVREEGCMCEGASFQTVTLTPSQLLACTYSLSQLRGADGQFAHAVGDAGVLRAVAEVLHTIGADLYCLQDIPGVHYDASYTEDALLRPIAAALGELCGGEVWHVASTVNDKRERAPLAILSRLPLSEMAQGAHQSIGACMAATVTLPSGQAVRVYNSMVKRDPAGGPELVAPHLAFIGTEGHARALWMGEFGSTSYFSSTMRAAAMAGATSLPLFATTAMFSTGAVAVQYLGPVAIARTHRALADSNDPNAQLRGSALSKQLPVACLLTALPAPRELPAPSALPVPWHHECTPQDHAAHPPLRAVANSCTPPLWVGTALDAPVLQKAGDRYKDMLIWSVNAITPENGAKWRQLQSTRGQFKFAKADAVVGWAVSQGMEVKGHALVWHNSVPPWLNEVTDAHEMERVLAEHIRTAMQHFRGDLRVRCWDVVNEAVSDTGGLRDSVFLRAMGDRFIEHAFRVAHEVDPQCLLLYNDYSIDALNKKSKRTHALLAALRDAGAPVHGIGLQAHLSLASPPDLASVRENARRFAALGLQVCISEMDVRVGSSKMERTEAMEQQRHLVRSFILAVAEGARLGGLEWRMAHADLPERDPLWGAASDGRGLNVPGFSMGGFGGVTFWGLSDRYSWVHSFFGPDAPLPLDEDCHPKPAYLAVLEALCALACTQSPCPIAPFVPTCEPFRSQPPSVAATAAAVDAAVAAAAMGAGAAVAAAAAGSGIGGGSGIDSAVLRLRGGDAAEKKDCKISGNLVHNVSKDGFVLFRGVTLPARLHALRLRVAAPAPAPLQIRLGSATGSLLASVTVPATGRDHSTLVTLTVPLAAADFGSGVHNLLVVFGQDNGCNLAWLELVGGDSMSPAVSLRADAAAEAQGCRVTGGTAAFTQKGGFLLFRAVPLPDTATSVSLLAATSQRSSVVEVRLDGPAGAVLARVRLAATDPHYSKYASHAAPLAREALGAGGAAACDLCVVFDREGCCNLREVVLA